MNHDHGENAGRLLAMSDIAYSPAKTKTTVDPPKTNTTASTY
jgi:hypothetical protein